MSDEDYDDDDDIAPMASSPLPGRGLQRTFSAPANSPRSGARTTSPIPNVKRNLARGISLLTDTKTYDVVHTARRHQKRDIERDRQKKWLQERIAAKKAALAKSAYHVTHDVASAEQSAAAAAPRRGCSGSAASGDDPVTPASSTTAPLPQEEGAASGGDPVAPAGFTTPLAKERAVPSREKEYTTSLIFPQRRTSISLIRPRITPPGTAPGTARAAPQPDHREVIAEADRLIASSPAIDAYESSLSWLSPSNLTDEQREADVYRQADELILSGKKTSVKDQADVVVAKELEQELEPEQEPEQDPDPLPAAGSTTDTSSEVVATKMMRTELQDASAGMNALDLSCTELHLHLRLANERRLLAEEQLVDAHAALRNLAELQAEHDALTLAHSALEAEHQKLHSRVSAEVKAEEWDKPLYNKRGLPTAHLVSQQQRESANRGVSADQLAHDCAGCAIG